MMTLFHTSHRLYKRYQPLIEDVITASGLALLVAVVLINLPVYPLNWAPVLVALVAIIGLRWSMPAYILAAAILVYPIYTVSLYLAVLFIAAAILLHRPAGHYLGATVLILATPLLSVFHLHWTVPILAGLWWGAGHGFWIGAAAACWGKLLGGMAGLDIDWLTMAGKLPTTAGVLQRYNALTPLETLVKLGQPFAPDPTLLLYHILQIVIWAVVAGMIGLLVQQKWLYRHFPWSTLVITALATLTLGAAHLLLAAWLRRIDPTSLDLQPILLTATLALVIGSTLEVALQSMELPVAPQVYKRVISVPVPRRQHATVSATSVNAERGQSQPQPVPLPELPEWEPPENDNNDLILLELD